MPVWVNGIAGERYWWMPWESADFDSGMMPEGWWKVSSSQDEPGSSFNHYIATKLGSLLSASKMKLLIMIGRRLLTSAGLIFFTIGTNESGGGRRHLVIIPSLGYEAEVRRSTSGASFGALNLIINNDRVLSDVGSDQSGEVVKCIDD